MAIETRGSDPFDRSRGEEISLGSLKKEFRDLGQQFEQNAEDGARHTVMMADTSLEERYSNEQFLRTKGYTEERIETLRAARLHTVALELPEALLMPIVALAAEDKKSLSDVLSEILTAQLKLMLK